jgi:hypothetical protein
MVADASTDGVAGRGVVLVTVLIAVSLTLALLVVSLHVGGNRIRGPEQMANPFYFTHVLGRTLARKGRK